jgi:hypothetical protein
VTGKPSIEIHYDSEDTGGSGEWAALYVDGKLITVGDAYVAEQQAFRYAGIKTVQDSAFMRGQKDRAGVADTLDEVATYRDDREMRAAHAAELRAEADRLRAQADDLVNWTSG